jgi:hypothetical protein
MELNSLGVLLFVCVILGASLPPGDLDLHEILFLDGLFLICCFLYYTEYFLLFVLGEVDFLIGEVVLISVCNLVLILGDLYVFLLLSCNVYSYVPKLYLHLFLI